ncbi:MAG: universal stress protein [Paracoccaceae bacterium]|nr:universal stress protein [Paracoccaceae bacterium]
MYQSILVPVDLSHPDAARKILSLARKTGGPDCRVMALNVIEEIPGFIAAELPEGLVARNVADAQETLSAMAADIGAEHEVRIGHASTTILDYASDMGADLIVLASHRPGIEDYFLGSTAARVVRHAACSVLVSR